MGSMEQLISTVNKLQDVFAVIGQPSTVDLPQIVVIGAYGWRHLGRPEPHGAHAHARTRPA